MEIQFSRVCTRITTKNGLKQSTKCSNTERAITERETAIETQKICEKISTKYLDYEIKYNSLNIT